MRIASLDATTLEACLSAAVAAPSFFNSQPWRYRLDPDTVTLEVRAAPERSLRHADPVGRALHISVGASVFNLRVAALHFGWSPVVRLLPSPEDPGLLATMRMTAPVHRTTDTFRADLYPAVWRRHSSRMPFSSRQVPPPVLAELAEAAHMEGALLTFPAPAETARMLRVVSEAEQRNRADTDRGTESRRWLHPDGAGATDIGLPRMTLGPQDAREQIPMRDFTAQRHPERLPAQDFETTPLIALLTTEHDRRTDWLRTGQALEHVLLVATAHGVRASLLHQPMEWPDLRTELNPVPEHTGHAQMLIRLGYGPEGPATPRRAPHAVSDPETLR
ncbi:Acg family FMN-binding oxidoreductase [Streptomyces griseorubiginosus]|uniref:Acg family FMN-binding oxidoreductase n=1 Tax=Streptomyces griseorubiginosus TaxID=67304 RepID=UPI0033C510FE